MVHGGTTESVVGEGVRNLVKDRVVQHVGEVGFHEVATDADRARALSLPDAGGSERTFAATKPERPVVQAVCKHAFGGVDLDALERVAFGTWPQEPDASAVIFHPACRRSAATYLVGEACYSLGCGWLRGHAGTLPDGGAGCTTTRIRC